MNVDTTARSAKKVLKAWFSDDADTIWQAYTKRWLAADKEDKHNYLTEFHELLVRCEENGFPISYSVGWALSAMARKHHELCENACGRELTIAEGILMNDILRVLSQAFEGSDIEVGSQDDPRGRTLLLFLPDKKYNSWDGESWRIPIP